MNKILKEDIESFSLSEDLTEELSGKKIIVTGATGLIGSIFVRCINALNIGVSFILPVRNANKAKTLFPQEADLIEIEETELPDFFRNNDSECDYIIHCASPTNGEYMTHKPVETFLLAIESTKEILEYARRKRVKGIVYVSSIEYYGQIFDNNPVSEYMTGVVDHTSTRSSYPLGKQAAEFLSFSFAKEYEVPVKIARLTQTFGAGISKDDNRVFAQFARSVIENKDIILHTKGESAKPYCYTTDAVMALIYILLRGENGEAYNVATPGTYVNIRRLAEMYRDNFNADISVEIKEIGNNAYAPVTTVNLDSSRLQSLGWRPHYNMKEMLGRLIEYLKIENIDESNS